MDARQDPMSDAVGDGPRLASARAREDHHGSVERLRDGALLRIEPQEGVDVRRSGHRGMVTRHPDD